MATRDFQVIFQNANQLPEDRYINVLHYADDNTEANRQAISDAIASAYVTHMQSLYTNDINGLQIRVYPPGLNPGGPELQTDYVFQGGGASGPQEVALCLSYFATLNQPRTRGRIYLGPFGQAQMVGRPSTALLNAAIALGGALGGAGGGSWLHRSKTPVEDYSPITDYWVDDAWDTMRSRGIAPSGRLMGTV